MKKLLLTMCAALVMSSGAQDLETSVAPKVTTLGIDNPKTALYVGNSYSFYNCGVHGYVRGLARAADRPWKARLQTISAGMLSFHDVERTHCQKAYAALQEVSQAAHRNHPCQGIRPSGRCDLGQGRQDEQGYATFG